MSANDLHFNPESILADWDTRSANLLREVEALKRNTTYQEGLRRGHPLEKGEVAAIHVLDIAGRVVEMLLQARPSPEELHRIVEAARREGEQATPLAGRLAGHPRLLDPMQRLADTKCFVPNFFGWIVVDSQAVQAAAELHQARQAIAPDVSEDYAKGVALRAQIGVMAGVNLALLFLWEDGKPIVGLMAGLNMLQLGVSLCIEYVGFKDKERVVFNGRLHFGIALNMTVGIGVSAIFLPLLFCVGLSFGLNIQMGVLFCGVWKLAG